MKRDIGFMDLDLFKKIIDQVSGYNDSVSLVNFGESTFHPDLLECINYAAENGIKPTLSTNATTLDKEKASMLLHSRLDKITLSLDGGTEGTYGNIRRGAGFDSVCDNITNFLQMKRSLNRKRPITEVALIMMKDTEKELEMFKERWKALADIVTIKPFLTWAGQVCEITGMASTGQLAFDSLKKERQPCFLLWKYGVVLWNGDVVPCCLDFDGKMVIGNLKNESLADIWNSEHMKEARRSHIKNKYDVMTLCENCREWAGEPKDSLFPFSINLLKRCFHKLKMIYGHV